MYDTIHSTSLLTSTNRFVPKRWQYLINNIEDNELFLKFHLNFVQNMEYFTFQFVSVGS